MARRKLVMFVIVLVGLLAGFASTATADCGPCIPGCYYRDFVCHGPGSTVCQYGGASGTLLECKQQGPCYWDWVHVCSQCC